MDTWIWIAIAVVVVVAALFVVGLVLAKRRQVSLTERTETPSVETDTKPKGGGYKAGGSISFSSGSGTAVEERPTKPEPAGSKPAQPAASPPVASQPVEQGTSEDSSPPPITESAVPAAEGSETEVAELVETAEPVRSAEPPDVTGAPEVTQPAGPTSVTTDSGVTEAAAAPEAASPVALPEQTAPEPAVSESAPPESTIPASTTPVTVPEAPAAPISVDSSGGRTEEIAPADGRLNRLRGRLARSQNAFGRSMLGLLGAGNLDEDSWMDVEDTLLLADLGAQASTEIAEKLRDEVASHGIADSSAARALLRRVLVEAVDPSMDRSVRALPHAGRPSVLLVVGVNGTGKTTTTGKLARVLVAQGREVVLGAADTFRAAAADQLSTWAERAGATVVRAKEGTDPASVAFDSVKAGIDGGADAVLIDTAGRLHTKTGLMDELGKVKRVVEKQAEVDEVLLVLDATTGQNGLVQARVFAEVVDITGIVLTKLDGTAKGGIVVAVQRALGVPVKLVGLGEGPDDLAPFEAEAFVDALLGD